MEESRVLPRKILVLSFLVFSLSLVAAPASWKFDATLVQSQLDAGATRITLRTANGPLALDIDRVTRNADGTQVVRAHPAGDDGWAVFSSSRGQWYGNVRTETHRYELRQNELVDVTDEPELPGLPPAVTRKATSVREPHPESLDAAANAEPVVVDVLMFYTSKLHESVSATDIQNVAVAAIEETNLAYERSGVSHRVRLVGLEETNYDELAPIVGNNAWDAARLRMVDPADGFMDEIPGRRDALHADAVALIIGRHDACGYTELMVAPASVAFAPQAYALVGVACAARQLALAHELGHIMGLEHDRESRDPNYEPAFPYAYGYRQPEDKFHTIMSTEFHCEKRCPLVGYFSNPDKFTEDGTPLGIPDLANNALALQQTMPIVARFRTAALPAMLVRSFTADRTQIERGQTVTLSWNTENATSIEITGLGTVAATGSITVTPLQSTTYTLVATQPGVESITSTVRVVVNCDGEPCAVPRRRAARH